MVMVYTSLLYVPPRVHCFALYLSSLPLYPEEVLFSTVRGCMFLIGVKLLTKPCSWQPNARYHQACDETS